MKYIMLGEFSIIKNYQDDMEVKVLAEVEADNAKEARKIAMELDAVKEARKQDNLEGLYIELADYKEV